MSSPEPPLRDELVAFTNDAPERTRDRLASGRRARRAPEEVVSRGARTVTHG